MSDLTLYPIRELFRRDYADPDDFEDAIEDAVREDNPWALLKTDPNTDQWIIDVVRGEPWSFCRFAYSVATLGLRTPAPHDPNPEVSP